MPVIVFESSKGGAGKTTSALLLALSLSNIASVTVIDADPNHPISRWGERNGGKIDIVTADDEDGIIDCIEAAAARTDYVIVDLEGTAGKIVLLAISQADFVVIPTQGSELDAAEASRGIRVIKQHEKIVGKSMPYAVLLTRTNAAIRTRNTSHIHNALIGAGIPVFEVELNEREAYKSVFAFGKRLEELDPGEVANLDKAIANVQAFAQELLQKILDVARLEAEAKAQRGRVAGAA